MRFQVGDRVRSIADTAHLGAVVAIGPAHAGIQYYRVFWGGPAGSQMVPETDLQHHQNLAKPSDALVAGPLSGHAEFQRVITYHRISRARPLRNNIYALNASRTKFYPFQFKPLIKLLDSPNGRLLICDEVGLGKTIEAGLILLEERARRDVRRVLVICPASLCAKWQLELRRRFGERFDILNAIGFRKFLDLCEDHPDTATLDAIISLNAARSPDLLARLDEVSPVFDLVIIDEAHHLRNFGTESRRAAVAFGRAADTLILLTATPVHLGRENLFSLLNILDDREFSDRATAEERFSQNEPIVAAQRLVAGGPGRANEALGLIERAASSQWLQGHPLLPRIRERLAALAGASSKAIARTLAVSLQRDLADLSLLGHVFTRTRKRDVKIKVAVREAHAWLVALTPQEREFYDSVSRLLLEERSRMDSPLVVQWALNTLQRRMASSIQATVEFYRTQMPFSAADFGDDDEDNGAANQVEVPQSATLGNLRQRVRQIVDTWPTGAQDSKYDRLSSLLEKLKAERPASKVLLFAFFKETLRYLARRLTRDGIGHVLIDGDVPPDERDRRIGNFERDPSCQLMLSSRVGSEGLDFQFCDTVVNYDLPWNPMEVEQRIGRVDRLGQAADRLLIFNLWSAGTIEERVLRRLYDRIGIFERSVGSLDAVIGDLLVDLDAVMVGRGLTAVQRDQEVERIARVIEAKRQHLEQLDDEAASFVGFDGYFDEEIEGIRRARRYVTGEQLLRFVEDYLRHRAAGTRIRYDPATSRGTLVPDAALRRLVQEHRRAGDLVRLMGAGVDGLPFTVQAEVAFDEPQLEFINVLHPLIEIIRADYAEALGERVSAQHVALMTSLLPVGQYVFVVYLLRVEGARALHFLEPIFLTQDLALACDRGVSEELLGEMVEKGQEPAEGGLSLDPALARAAACRAQELFLDRLDGLRRELELTNTAFVDRRATSVRFQFDGRLQRQRELLERHRSEGRPERVLQLTRGRISKLEGQMSQRLAELEGHRRIQVGYDEITAGLLEVLP